MEKPLFSVIIPVYQVENYLDACISSVLRQSCGDFEIILVDDGSPDRCPAICDGWAESDSRVRVLHKANGGLSSARNAGLDIAGGEYVIFLDSDDYWKEERLLASASAFLREHSEKQDIDVILFQAEKYFEKKEQFVPDRKYCAETINHAKKHDTIRYLVESGTYSMSACTKIVKRAVLVEKNVRFGEGLLGEDLDWFFQLVFSVENLYAIEDCAYVYRMRDGSITHTIGKKNLEDSFYIIGKWNAYLENCSLKETDKRSYYSILAYAQVVNMLNYNRLEQTDKKALQKKVKEHCRLLKFGENKRVKYTYLIYRLCGFWVTSKCLAAYSKMIH